MIPAVEDDPKGRSDLRVRNGSDAILFVSWHIDLIVRDVVLLQEFDIRCGIFIANQRPIDNPSENARGQRAGSGSLQDGLQAQLLQIWQVFGLGEAAPIDHSGH
jgi:hypothetical protein